MHRSNLIEAPDNPIACSRCQHPNRHGLDGTNARITPGTARYDRFDVSEYDENQDRDSDGREQRVSYIFVLKVWYRRDEAAQKVRDAHAERRDPSSRGRRSGKFELEIHHELGLVSIEIHPKT